MMRPLYHNAIQVHMVGNK